MVVLLLLYLLNCLKDLVVVLLLFTNQNTFGASGIEQRDYYDILIKRITFNGFTKDFLKEKLSNTKNDIVSYYINKNIKDCILCIVDLYFINKDIDKGIKYFKDNYYERSNEVKEYILLCEIEDYGLYDEWIKEYESNIGKIDYRDILIEKYNELKGIVILQVLFYI